jgi:hypothetical protein
VWDITIEDLQAMQQCTADGHPLSFVLDMLGIKIPPESAALELWKLAYEVCENDAMASIQEKRSIIKNNKTSATNNNGDSNSNNISNSNNNNSNGSATNNQTQQLLQQVQSYQLVHLDEVFVIFKYKTELIKGILPIF